MNGGPTRIPPELVGGDPGRFARRPRPETCDLETLRLAGVPELLLEAACTGQAEREARTTITSTPPEVERGQLLRCPTCSLPSMQLFDGVCGLCFAEGAHRDYDPDRDGYIWEWRGDLCR